MSYRKTRLDRREWRPHRGNPIGYLQVTKSDRDGYIHAEMHRLLEELKTLRKLSSH